ncbi:MAG: hemolysin III family protein [Rhizobiaceae bacterium]
MSERVLSHAEHTADGVIHVAGIVASLVAVAFLMAAYLPQGSAGMSAALAVYGVTVILLFCASAAYHLIPHHDWKPLLQRFDHAAIFLKIAGTYTPLVVVMGSLFAYGVLAMVWAGALAGAAMRITFGDRFAGFSAGLYLMLGWTSVALIWLMFERLPTGAAVMVIIGGLLYTVGVAFHVWENLRFQKAIWHAFVLAASTCHFIAVAWSSLQLTG